MSIWGWIYESMNPAHEERAAGCRELYDFYQAAQNVFESDPDAALVSLEQGRIRARQLNEPWWELFFEHWKLQALIQRKGDHGTALGLAARATLEVRKPIYRDFPQRICLHEDLINAYLGSDPMGHEERIEAALDYMETEIAPEVECRYCLAGLRAEFEHVRALSTLGVTTEATLRVAESYVAMAQASTSYAGPHYVMEAYIVLCRAVHAAGREDDLLDCAREAETHARRQQVEHRLAEALMWQAVALARQSDHDSREAAARLQQQAAFRMNRLGATPSDGYFEAWAEYSVARGEYLEALRVREIEFEQIKDKGRVFAEARCRLECCKLSKVLGLPLDEELEAARQAASRLTNPEAILRELEKIAEVA